MSLDLGTNQTTKGEAFTGREMVYSNGSLEIKNITLEYTKKVFMVHVYDKNGKLFEGSMWFTVYPWVKNISCTSNGTTAVEYQDTIEFRYGPDSPTLFPSDTLFQVGSKIRIFCESVSQPKAQYFWTLNGKPWNASKEVNINNATLNHTGRYVCTASNPTSNVTNSTAREVTVYRK
ncbi:cell adhesion molecule CEACAM2-like [Microtus pennsylvanicus]|uniref:cell adhesion molecule CEACAM2-like n=1 Tax=Microtus pennsylvanicus TaxID=10058 RepID=UPI003F6C28A0